jgi:hypothetical protein
MDSTINTAHLFDAWLGQLWRAVGRLDAARRDAQAMRARRDASDGLRERIAQYEQQQPGYAADLRAALARQEAANARY